MSLAPSCQITPHWDGRRLPADPRPCHGARRWNGRSAVAQRRTADGQTGRLAGGDHAGSARRCAPAARGAATRARALPNLFPQPSSDGPLSAAGGMAWSLWSLTVGPFATVDYNRRVCFVLVVYVGLLECCIAVLYLAKFFFTKEHAVYNTKGISSGRSPALVVRAEGQVNRLLAEQLHVGGCARRSSSPPALIRGATGSGSSCGRVRLSSCSMLLAAERAPAGQDRKVFAGLQVPAA